MASKLFKKNELKFEDFEPTHELQELPENYILLINIPGFKKEDFKVQIDSSGKLSVRGNKIADNKCKRFNKIVQLPPDFNIEKIRGKFEGDVLTLNVSRKEKALPPNQEAKSSAEGAEAKPREEAKDSEEKEKESKPKENSSDKKEEESKLKEEPKQTKDKKEEEKEEKPKEAEADRKIKEEPKANAEKKDELTKTKEQTGTPEMEETASNINDEINKWKQRNISGEDNDNTIKKSALKKIVNWKERIRQEARDWSDYASFDNMLDVINSNKKEIAVAVAAFSIGFMVARKLNSGK